MQSKKLESLEQIEALKSSYMQCATAPLDGMWLTGFVPQAAHYGLFRADQLAGFYCVNEDGFLLQFFVLPEHRDSSAAILGALLEAHDPPAIQGAFASTAEPQYFVACLDTFSACQAHTLMYQLDSSREHRTELRGPSELPLQEVGANHLSEVVGFANQALGAPESWLGTYHARIIERGEVLGFWSEARLIAIGENRAFDQFQTDYSDLGVIVAKSERGKGLATQVLRRLVARNLDQRLIPICSTEVENVGAQVAIRRAGFSAPHRIVRFTRS